MRNLCTYLGRYLPHSQITCKAKSNHTVTEGGIFTADSRVESFLPCSVSCLFRVISHPSSLGIPDGNYGKLTQRTSHPIIVPPSNSKHCHSTDFKHVFSPPDHPFGIMHCSQLRLPCSSSWPKPQAAIYITISETVSMLASATHARTRGFIDAGEVPETWRACRVCRAKDSRPATLYYGESTVDDSAGPWRPFGQSASMLDYSSRSSDGHGT